MPETPIAESTALGWVLADLWTLCDRYPPTEGRPGLMSILRAGLELEDSAPRENPYWNGWTWRDVRAQPTILHQAELAGLIRASFHSRSQTCYRVNSPELMAQALDSYLSGPATATAPESDGPPVLPDDAFDVIVGHTQVKHLIRGALAAARPVHVLLTGPPGTAKTLFLSDVSRIPGARYALGGNTTRAGLLDYLISQPTCRVLVLDEIDKANMADLSALLSVMESGVVSRLQHGRAEQVRRQVWVIAGCNRTDGIRGELLSRFAISHLPEYSAMEFQHVARNVLVRREGADPELAREIATRLAGLTTDVRTAVRVCRLCQGDRSNVPEVLSMLGLPS